MGRVGGRRAVSSDAGEQDGDRLAGATTPWRRSSSSPARPAVPVGSQSMPVAARPSSFASSSVASSTTTGRPPLASVPRTMASQSYVSSSRIPPATLWGSCSQGHMNAER